MVACVHDVGFIRLDVVFAEFRHDLARFWQVGNFLSKPLIV